MKQPQLNRLLTLEQPTRSPDGAGGFVDVWTPLGTLWANVKARSGAEAEADTVRRSKNIYAITVRAAPHGAPSRPRPDQRFREGTRVYQIVAVTEQDSTRRYLTCTATQEVMT